MKNVFSKNRIIGLIFVVIGILTLVFSMQIPVYPGAGDPGSRLFPQIAGVIMAVMGALMMITDSGNAGKTFLTGEQWKKLLLLYAIYILFYVAWLVFGYPVSSVLFLYVVCTLFSKGKNVPLWQRVLFSVGFAAAVYLIFNTLLGIRLPMGILFGG